jgi:hypothetical protein
MLLMFSLTGKLKLRGADIKAPSTGMLGDYTNFSDLALCLNHVHFHQEFSIHLLSEALF